MVCGGVFLRPVVCIFRLLSAAVVFCVWLCVSVCCGGFLCATFDCCVLLCVVVCGGVSCGGGALRV